jgi:hypothetical protein
MDLLGQFSIALLKVSWTIESPSIRNLGHLLVSSPFNGSFMYVYDVFIHFFLPLDHLTLGILDLYLSFYLLMANSGLFLMYLFKLFLTIGSPSIENLIPLLIFLPSIVSSRPIFDVFIQTSSDHWITFQWESWTFTYHFTF